MTDTLCKRSALKNLIDVRSSSEAKDRLDQYTRKLCLRLLKQAKLFLDEADRKTLNAEDVELAWQDLQYVLDSDEYTVENENDPSSIRPGSIVQWEAGGEVQRGPVLGKTNRGRYVVWSEEGWQTLHLRDEDLEIVQYPQGVRAEAIHEAGNGDAVGSDPV